jgi:L-asparaginase / beta-aspartyl-peptidase
MNPVAIVVHGGASIRNPFLSKNKKECAEGLHDAVKEGYQILLKGGTALNAVERSVTFLEDHHLFNAGRGSALNNKGEIEMDASIMDGKTLKAGAVSMVRNVKNPIGLARIVMSKTRHVLLSGYGAVDLAKAREITLEPDSYFMTEHQYQAFLTLHKETSIKEMLKQKLHGTVGAVAVDKKGNVAAATSTGGTSNRLPGRIGDSCIIGAGCYANNQTCAVSGTGEGEILIRGVIAHTISVLVELKKYSLQEACNYVVQIQNKRAHIGVIAVNAQGDIGVSFNTAVMRCAWMRSDQTEPTVKIFKYQF